MIYFHFLNTSDSFFVKSLPLQIFNILLCKILRCLISNLTTLVLSVNLQERISVCIILKQSIRISKVIPRNYKVKRFLKAGLV